MRSAARDDCRVLKQTNGEGVKQIVVNEETVKPRRVFLESVSSVVTNTTGSQLCWYARYLAVSPSASTIVLAPELHVGGHRLGSDEEKMFETIGSVIDDS
jgi:hypothetical protein